MTWWLTSLNLWNNNCLLSRYLFSQTLPVAQPGLLEPGPGRSCTASPHQPCVNCSHSMTPPIGLIKQTEPRAVPSCDLKIPASLIMGLSCDSRRVRRVTYKLYILDLKFRNGTQGSLSLSHAKNPDSDFMIFSLSFLSFWFKVLIMLYSHLFYISISFYKLLVPQVQIPGLIHLLTLLFTPHPLASVSSAVIYVLGLQTAFVAWTGCWKKS